MMLFGLIMVFGCLKKIMGCVGGFVLDLVVCVV